MKRTVVFTLSFLILSSFMVASIMSITSAEDFWIWKSAMDKGRSGLGVAVVGDKIYAIGGTSGDLLAINNEEYDPITDAWATKAPMPTPRSGFGIAVYGNKIYCIGGQVSGFLATGVNEVYDPETDTWEIKTSMPTPAIGIRANVVAGEIYVVGGSTDRALNLNQVYDPATDSWATKASIPTAVYSYASAVIDNKIYFFTSNLTQIYNVENDTWSLGTPSPSPLILATAAATAGLSAPERIYIFGANAELPFWQLTTKGFITQSYDPKTGNWTLGVPMPAGRYAVGVAVLDDLLYVIGGFTTEFPSDRFTLNAIYTYSALNQQYKPIGYGTVLPQISIVSSGNKTYTSSNVSLAVTVNKAVSWQGYSLDGQENVTITGNITIAGLPNGFHKIRAYAKDELENIISSETVTFTVATELFPTTNAIAISGIFSIIICAGIVVYLRKHKTS